MSNKFNMTAIGNPEFINIEPYNPLISKCEIKVLYIGQNRNHTYIDKETAIKMANSLPGNPIVGYYREEKQDFTDHGDKIIIDDMGVKVECMTRPYGFIAPDAKVWFQKFKETDEFGNEIEREYLMVVGYLWTGQYEEAQQILDDGGKPHSMELDEESLKGHWANDNKTGLDFFIINDAIFSKLCALGDDVEPCFEGSSITAPEISSSFTVIDNAKFQALVDTINDLKFALKGGNQMSDITKVGEDFETKQAPTSEFVQEEDKDKEKDMENKEEEKDIKEKEEDKYKEEKEDKTKCVKEEKEEDDKTKCVKEEDKTKCVKEEKEEDDKTKCVSKDDEKEKEEVEKKYSLLQEQYNNLKKDYDELLQFKLQVERKEKEDLINSFYMLDSEDKKDVQANIDKYSKDDIEAKLSIICVRKKVNFDLEDSSKNQNNIEDNVTTYNINSNIDSSIPAWVKAVMENEE